LYNKNNLQTEKFEYCESHALNDYGIPVVAFATFRWHLYLHEHYHLTDTPLERFAWFRKKRRVLDRQPDGDAAGNLKRRYPEQQRPLFAKLRP